MNTCGIYFERIAVKFIISVPNYILCTCRNTNCCCRTIANQDIFFRNKVKVLGFNSYNLVGVMATIDIGLDCISAKVRNHECCFVEGWVVVPYNILCIFCHNFKSYRVSVAELNIVELQEIYIFGLVCNNLVGVSTAVNLCRYIIGTTFVDYKSLTVVSCVAIPNYFGCIVYCKFQSFGCAVAEVYGFVSYEVDIFALGCSYLVGKGTAINLCRNSVYTRSAYFVCCSVVCRIL